MAEDKHLGAELRIGARADQYEVSNEADELVAEAEKHAGGSCPIAPTIHGRDSQLGPGGVTPGPAPGVPIELTPHRLRHRRAGINRHEGGDERALHRRPSEPRWP